MGTNQMSEVEPARILGINGKRLNDPSGDVLSGGFVWRQHRGLVHLQHRGCFRDTQRHHPFDAFETGLAHPISARQIPGRCCGHGGVRFAYVACHPYLRANPEPGIESCHQMGAVADVSAELMLGLLAMLLSLFMHPIIASVLAFVAGNGFYSSPNPLYFILPSYKDFNAFFQVLQAVEREGCRFLEPVRRGFCSDHVIARPVAVSHKGIGVAAVFRKTFSTASAYAEGFGGQEERKEPKAGMSISTEGNEGNKDWKQPSLRSSLRLHLLVYISCRRPP